MAVARSRVLKSKSRSTGSPPGSMRGGFTEYSSEHDAECTLQDASTAPPPPAASTRAPLPNGWPGALKPLPEGWPPPLKHYWPTQGIVCPPTPPQNSPQFEGAPRYYSPPTTYEIDDGTMYCISMALPGVRTSEIEAVIDGRMLHVLVDCWLKDERLERSFKLPEDADVESDAVLLTHKDGMLSIFVPKHLSV